MSTNSKRLIYFFLLTYLFTWTFWGISLLDSKDIITSPVPTNLLGIIGTFGPSIIGTIFLIRFHSRTFLSIIKETFILKGRWNWKLLTFFLMPTILGTSYLITRFIFGIEYELEWFQTPTMIPIVFLFILFLGGPLGEEIGWRGFALKELLKKLTPFTASLILGIIWTCWHIPAFFIEGTAQQGISFYLYTINTLVLTMIITLLYMKTHFRISAALYYHASANFALGIFYIIDEPLGLLFIGIFMITTITFILVRYREQFFTLVDQNKL